MAADGRGRFESTNPIAQRSALFLGRFACSVCVVPMGPDDDDVLNRVRARSSPYWKSDERVAIQTADPRSPQGFAGSTVELLRRGPPDPWAGITSAENAATDHNARQRQLYLLAIAPQGFLLESDKRRQQIADDPAGASLNFDGYRHPRRKIGEPVFHRDLGSIERYTRGVAEFLTFGLAARAFRIFRSGISRILGRDLASNRIAGDAHHTTMNEPVAGEVERIDFDLSVLAHMNKPNVPIRDPSFYLKYRIRGHDDGQLLCRRHDAAYGMDRKLLHDAIDRRGQEFGASFAAPLLPDRP